MDSTKRGPTRKRWNSAFRRFRHLRISFPVSSGGWRHLLLLLLACFLSPGARAAVRFDMFVGYDGIVPVGSWFPMAFEVQNDGPPFTATVEISPGQFNSAQNRTMVVELPTGTTKRFIIPTFNAGSYYPTWSARLLDERRRVRAETTSQRVRRLNEAVVPLAAAMSRVLPSLPEVKSRQEELRPVFGRLQPAVFPDNPLSLEGLDTLYLSSERALELKANQVGALLAWLHGGGHLVVGIEQINHLSGPGEWLRQLLPVEATGMTSLAAHEGLQAFVTSAKRHDGTSHVRPQDRRGGNRSSPGGDNMSFSMLQRDAAFEDAPLQVITGRLRDGRVVVDSAGTPLILSAERGRGHLTMLMFAPELEPFRSWKNAPHFWAKMIDLPPALLASESFNQYPGRPIDGVFGAIIDSKQIRKLPVGWLLLLLLGYLAVIGPLDQFWLKKLNKQMLTWLTFPAYVAFFSLLIYFIGYKLRAGETEWNELHVVDVIPHGDTADLRGRSFGSIYSPVNAQYLFTSEQPFATLRGEYSGNYGGGQEGSRSTVEQRPAGFRAQASVPVWTSQLFVSDWWRQSPTPVSLAVTPAEITIDNNLDVPLTNVRVVIGGEMLLLDNVPASEKKTFARRGLSRTNLSVFVQDHARQFQGAVNARQQAFGSDARSRISDAVGATMAATFIDLNAGQNSYENFSCPPGFELSHLTDRGDAVLLAWLPNHSLTQPLNQFAAVRGSKNTLLRVACEVGK